MGLLEHQATGRAKRKNRTELSVIVMPNHIVIYKMTDTELEVNFNYTVWAKIINCTKIETKD